MTWVIGGRHLACARCVADIQITLSWDDGSRPKQYVDAVRKIHLLSDDLVIAFSGSVRIGFSVVELLRANCVPKLEPRLFTEPDEVARRVARQVKYAYNVARVKEADVANFLLFVRDPTNAYSQVGVYRICSPKFEVERPLKPFELMEIGTGAVLDDYREIVDRHAVPGYLVNEPGEEKPSLVIPVGAIALKFLQQEAAEYQNAGISRAMHLMLMYIGGTTIVEHAAQPDDAFPWVANTWAELVRNMDARGIELTSCEAFA